MAKSGQHGGNILQMAEKFHLHPEQLIDFSANINPLGMPKAVRQTIIQQIDCLEQYPDIEYQKLHNAIAHHHQCSPDWVVAGNGATELIFLWTQAIQPKKALLIEPSFSEYRRALTRIRCQIEEFILREDEGFQVTERLLDRLSNDLDCLFICTPNNPTGLIPDERLMEALVQRCHECEIELFVDESFLDFMPQRPSLRHLMGNFPHLYLLHSLTKFYALPGLRLGYLLSANSALLHTIRNEREPWTINALASLAGEMLFDELDYPIATHVWLREEQQYLMDELSQFSQLHLYPPCANYLFFKHNHKTSLLQNLLMEYGILIRSCANYPGLDEHFYRIAIKSRKHNQQLIKALKRVLNHG